MHSGTPEGALSGMHSGTPEGTPICMQTGAHAPEHGGVEDGAPCLRLEDSWRLGGHPLALVGLPPGACAPALAIGQAAWLLPRARGACRAAPAKLALPHASHAAPLWQPDGDDGPRRARGIKLGVCQCDTACFEDAQASDLGRACEISQAHNCGSGGRLGVCLWTRLH